LFSEDGPLAREVDGYRTRPGQIEMAEDIAHCIETTGTLIAEAGTGTGKTFAYLAPALIWGGKVVVSTGTKTLQDQLFRKDLPLLRKAIGAPIMTALLKGRANYVCHYHLQRTESQGRLGSRQDVAYLRSIVRFMQSTRTGDRSEVIDVPENAGIWSQVTSTRDNCKGLECPNYRECFVMQARREAQQADVVVVNHHLFFADLMLREEGVTDLLPTANTVIFDEAHQLPEIASLFFGRTASTAQLLELARDTVAEGLMHARDAANWPTALAPLERAARELRLAFPQDVVRLNARQVPPTSPLFPALDNVIGALGDLERLLVQQAERSETLEQCLRRARDLAERLTSWRDTDQPATIRWVEAFSHSLQLHQTPLSVAETFSRAREAHASAWIFTSATLAVKDDFSLFCGQLGLDDAKAKAWPSPFDYENQALLYVPEALPDPLSRGYTEAVVRAALPVIRASGGRAFLLCTTLRAVKLAAEELRIALEQEGLDFPLLVQGDGTRSDLLERFRALGNAVLVGSQSFWEGVDVRGQALSLVIIDKLPFAPPDDPVLAARLEALAELGGNPFMDYQLPSAVITLKQGAGRLIRDETDRGLLMICDPRLISKPYGRRIWQSLPPFKRTRLMDEALAFFDTCNLSAR
jgi:ATP-dependent DNA helicase DinG